MANHQADNLTKWWTTYNEWLVDQAKESHMPTESGARTKAKLQLIDWTVFGVTVDRQGIPIDPEIASTAMVIEHQRMMCENGVYWNCDHCACEDDPQRHT